jgi:hypothetical protein
MNSAVWNRRSKVLCEYPRVVGNSEVDGAWLDLPQQLPCRPRAIDEDRVPGNKGRCARGKEYHRTRHLHRLTNAVQGSNALDHV